jgi:hypothetical protein
MTNSLLSRGGSLVDSTWAALEVQRSFINAGGTMKKILAIAITALVLVSTGASAASGDVTWTFNVAETEFVPALSYCDPNPGTCPPLTWQLEDSSFVLTEPSTFSTLRTT